MTTTLTMLRQYGAALLVLALVACGGEEASPDAPDIQTMDDQESESGAAGSVLKVKGQLFSIPSPIQAAMLIKEANIEMSPDLANDVKNKDSYVTSFQKAVNLGIYGADLGYLSNFDDPAKHLSYFNAIQGLAGDLDINNNIEPELLLRFAKSIDQPDSLYALNADLYLAINQYLKANEQNETASLILAGGWLEALWISLDQAEANTEIRERIAQQRNGLNSLVVLLQDYEDEQVQAFRTQLKALSSTYDKIQVDYTYVKPISDPASRTTFLKSTSTVNLDDETLAEITEQVTSIRNSVIQ